MDFLTKFTYGLLITLGVITLYILGVMIYFNRKKRNSAVRKYIGRKK